MGEVTKINWAFGTFNIAWGCSVVDAMCDKCYARTFDRRIGGAHWGKGERRIFGPKHWAMPVKWNRDAAKAGERRRIFCASMCDVFEDHPAIEQERAKLWPLIRATAMLDWMLLTKRPERIRMCLPPDWGDGYANVWLGASAQQSSIQRVRDLVQVPAAIHWLSAEPLLEETQFPLDLLAQLDLVIVGGESDVKPRPMDPDWARIIRDDCARTSTNFWMKQMGGRPGDKGEELENIPADLRIRQMPESAAA